MARPVPTLDALDVTTVPCHWCGRVLLGDRTRAAILSGAVVAYLDLPPPPAAWDGRRPLCADCDAAGDRPAPTRRRDDRHRAAGVRDDGPLGNWLDDAARAAEAAADLV